MLCPPERRAKIKSGWQNKIAAVPLPFRFWADLSTRDFAQLDPASTVAVLPVAATEQHGPHLPLSVDQSIADGIIASALPRLPADLPVLFLPTQQVGYSPEHVQFPGTLTLSSATVIATWIELGECVARSGVKKLLLFNSHGGQVSLMDIVARELRSRCGLIVYRCSWWNLPLGDVSRLTAPDPLPSIESEDKAPGSGRWLALRANSARVTRSP